ncbi:MAG: PolC-type DNA polymerase III [Lactobacillaceae bacterium]|jgi:DNA polymerase-3 subunit alpha (Gram-positive type)|nr:PolC-type DNA polymerase III [Lactobacillaceae bacterium]
MAISPQEQFQVLLQQLEINDVPASFMQAALTKLVVHEKSNVWQFNIAVSTLPDVHDLALFVQRMQMKFATIAEPTLQLNLQTQPDLTQILTYWPWVLQQHQQEPGAFNNAFANTQPVLVGDKIQLSFDAEMWKNYAEKSGLAIIQRTYTQLGVNNKLPIEIVVDAQLAEASMAQMREQQAAQERQFAENVAAQIQSQAKAREAHEMKTAKVTVSDTQMGKPINATTEITKMINVTMEEHSVTFEGFVFGSEVKELKNDMKLATIKMSDYTSSFILKKFIRNEEELEFLNDLKDGAWVRARGPIKEDTFMHDLTMMVRDIDIIKHSQRTDQYQGAERRLDLHVHSIMSTMDATNSIGDYIKTAARWGMNGLALTDTAGAQSFPEAASTAKGINKDRQAAATKAAIASGIAENDEAGIKAYVAEHVQPFKMIYGVEINLVEDGQAIALNTTDIDLATAQYVVFDVETTGLSPAYDKVIQLSAVKMERGMVIDEFDEYLNPGEPLSPKIIEITHITDDMLQGSRSEKAVFSDFKKWAGDAILVGHNVIDFDVPMVNNAFVRNDIAPIDNVVIDTLNLAHFLYPDMRRFTLSTLAKRLGVPLDQAHNAIYDATATGHVNFKMLSDAKERYAIQTAAQLNEHITDNDSWKHERPKKATVLVKEQVGVKNLYKLISASNTEYLSRQPRVPRSLLNKYREGLLIGTGDTGSEFWEGLERKGKAFAKDKAAYYDFIEIQPLEAYSVEIEREMIRDEARLRDLIQQAVEIGAELNKPVVVTGDVHYLNPEDAIYRKILINSQGGANPLNRYQLPELHLRTTQELLTEFAFLGEQTAFDVVVHNTNVVADMIEDVVAIKAGNYPPNMPTANQEMHDRTYETAYKLYGKPLPLQIEARIERELNSIINNGFSVIYLVAQRLVAKSNKDGYLVGSRGSVGSSLAALLAGITEVNALPPHYRSVKGDYVEFVDPREYESGYDIPQKNSPIDGTNLVGDGHNIPFETFLGFKGNKVPDIDLNFSGDYQPFAHNYMKSLFGENNVFRAGTIATVADKTAFGYVKAYERDNELELRGAEVERLAQGATGVKRTTGQHPAGILIVPDDMEIYDFTPIQFPADDVNATWKTTHFDFHSIHDNILKMDILGHDDPTMIRALQDMSGIDPQTIPMNDQGVMSLFQSPDALGVTADQIYSKTGTLGVPEFGTNFVRGMLQETNPTNYSELLQISGLSHGTDVWRGNADELIQQGKATIATVIGTRDKIMTDLINWGVNPESSFQIMEKVRKGKGISDEYQAEMRAAGVPEWYIESGLKIKYMFPRAHAAAYVLMALRIAYFKVYFPTLYYAAYFSVRASNFDVVAMAHGLSSTKAKIEDIKRQGLDASAKDRDLVTVLEIANEAMERGLKFSMVDLYKSDAEQWVIEDDTLIAPFNAVPSLGDNVAKKIMAARAEGEFLSKEDLSKRGGVSQTLMTFFDDNGVLEGMSDENQLALF